MKLDLSSPSGIHLITAYGSDYVTVNARRHERSLIVLPDALHEDWPVAGFDSLAAGHFDRLLDLNPEMVLLGTGKRLRFPAPALYVRLSAARIGVEVMDTGAACRTYNFLAGEGRRVAAALILGD